MKAPTRTKTMRFSLTHLNWLEKVAANNGLSEREVLSRIMDLTLPQLMDVKTKLHWCHIKVENLNNG